MGDEAGAAAVRDRKKEKNIKHDGNITLDQVIEIARTMRPRSMARMRSQFRMVDRRCATTSSRSSTNGRNR